MISTFDEKINQSNFKILPHFAFSRTPFWIAGNTQSNNLKGKKQKHSTTPQVPNSAKPEKEILWGRTNLTYMPEIFNCLFQVTLLALLKLFATLLGSRLW